MTTLTEYIDVIKGVGNDATHPDETPGKGDGDRVGDQAVPGDVYSDDQDQCSSTCEQ